MSKSHWDCITHKSEVKIVTYPIQAKTNKWGLIKLTSFNTASKTEEYMSAQSCLTLCDAMDYSLPGSSVRGTFQARILEWVAISCSRESSWHGDWTCVSCIGRRILYHCAAWKATLRYSIPGGSDSKESTCSMGNLGSIPGLGRSLGGGHGNPLQYSCLENTMDRGVWRATSHGVTKSRTQLSD